MLPHLLTVQAHGCIRIQLRRFRHPLHVPAAGQACSFAFLWVLVIHLFDRSQEDGGGPRQHIVQHIFQEHSIPGIRLNEWLIAACIDAFCRNVQRQQRIPQDLQ